MNENFQNQNPEFSHPIEVDNVPNNGRFIKLEPNAEELVLLAQRFDLLSLDNVKATVQVKPFSGGKKMRVSGHILADITQACIINLSPVQGKIDEEFEVDFAPPTSIEYDVELTFDDDIYEPIENGVIDLGEVVAQQICLAINPYPRSKEADLDTVRKETAGKNGPKFDVNAKPNPFAVLENFKKKS